MEMKQKRFQHEVYQNSTQLLETNVMNKTCQKFIASTSSETLRVRFVTTTLLWNLEHKHVNFIAPVQNASPVGLGDHHHHAETLDPLEEHITQCGYS